MKKVIFFVVILTTSVLSKDTVTNESRIDENLILIIENIFSKMQNIQSMKPLIKYSSQINGVYYTEWKDFFLRKRTAEEIIDSKLSSGCGDYAFVFDYLLKKEKIKSYLVDGVLISNRSLINNFSGHVVVAIFCPAFNKWVLVDSTSRKIIDYDWNFNSNFFNAYFSEFWIGFKGDYNNYPIKNEEELKSFYDSTIKKIPLNVLNDKIIGFKLKIDDNTKLDSNQSQYINRINNWLLNAYNKYNLSPNKTFTVIIKSSDKDKTLIYRSEVNQWVYEIGKTKNINLSIIDEIEFAIKSNQ